MLLDTNATGFARFDKLCAQLEAVGLLTGDMSFEDFEATIETIKVEETETEAA